MQQDSLVFRCLLMLDHTIWGVLLETSKRYSARAIYLRQIIQINRDLVLVSVCDFLQQILIFQLRYFRLTPCFSARKSHLVIIIHKVVLVAEVIFVNVHVTQSAREAILGGGRLESLEEVLECRCRTSADARL